MRIIVGTDATRLGVDLRRGTHDIDGSNAGGILRRVDTGGPMHIVTKGSQGVNLCHCIYQR